MVVLLCRADRLSSSSRGCCGRGGRGCSSSGGRRCGCEGAGSGRLREVPREGLHILDAHRGTEIL